MHDDPISRATLDNLAGTAAFRRGEEYIYPGAVGRLCDAEVPDGAASTADAIG